MKIRQIEMKHPRNYFGQQLMLYILLVSLSLQSCSNLSQTPIVPIKEKPIPIIQQVSQPEEPPEEESVSLYNAITSYSNPTILNDNSNKESDIISAVANLEEEIPAVEQADLSSPIEDLSSSSLNNYLSTSKAYDRDDNISYQQEQPTKHRPTKQNLPQKQPYSPLTLEQGSTMLLLPGYKLLHCLHEGSSSNIYRGVAF